LPFDAEKQADYRLDFPPGLSLEFRDLVSSILNVYPDKRLTAEEVLMHRWFANTPDYIDIMDE